MHDSCFAFWKLQQLLCARQCDEEDNFGKPMATNMACKELTAQISRADNAHCHTILDLCVSGLWLQSSAFSKIGRSGGCPSHLSQETLSAATSTQHTRRTLKHSSVRTE